MRSQVCCLSSDQSRPHSLLDRWSSAYRLACVTIAFTAALGKLTTGVHQGWRLFADSVSVNTAPGGPGISVSLWGIITVMGCDLWGVAPCPAGQRHLGVYTASKALVCSSFTIKSWSTHYTEEVTESEQTAGGHTDPIHCLELCLVKFLILMKLGGLLFV